MEISSLMPNFVPNFIKKSMKRLHFLIILSFITIFSSAEPYCDVRKFSILDGLAANSISDLAQGCKTYDEFIEKMKEVSEIDLNYLGIAICGSKKKVNKLTGSMPLLR